MKKDDHNVIGSPPATISGVLLWDSQVYLIKVRLPVLILDVYSWVAAEAVKFEDLSEITENLRESRLYARQGSILRRWLKNPIHPTHEFPALAMRQIWDRHLRITRDNLAEYVAIILAVAEPASENAQPEFLFCANFQVPELITLPLFREIAAHTGPHVLGRVVQSREEMHTLAGRLSQQVLREGQMFRLRDGEEPQSE